MLSVLSAAVMALVRVLGKQTEGRKRALRRESRWLSDAVTGSPGSD